MNTKIFTKYELSEAAAMIRSGGLVAMPTETVYGLAANALDENAVKKIYKAKGRESDNPLIVHIANIRDWKNLVTSIPRSAQILAQKFWPGPLTIILKKSDIVPSVVSGGLDTVAVRMPKNKIAFNFIKECGCPLAAPSANISGKPSPTKLEHVVNDLNGKVDGIIDGGNCEVGVESTVISLAEEVPIVLRPGRITVEQLREALGEVRIHHAVIDNLKEGEKATSPGMKYKHYSPKAEVYIVDGSNNAYEKYVKKYADDKTAVICFDEQAENLIGCHIFKIGASYDSVTQAQELFDVLRAIDKAGYKRAFSPMPTAQGVGLAVVNRLLRAAGFKIIDLAKIARKKSKTTEKSVKVQAKKEPKKPIVSVKAENNISDQTRELFAQNIKSLLVEKNVKTKKPVVEKPKVPTVEHEAKASHRNNAHTFDELDYEKYARALKSKPTETQNVNKSEKDEEQKKPEKSVKVQTEEKNKQKEPIILGETKAKETVLATETPQIVIPEEKVIPETEEIAITEPALTLSEMKEKEVKENKKIKQEEKPEVAEEKNEKTDNEASDGIVFEIATEPAPVEESENEAYEPVENEIVMSVSEAVEKEEIAQEADELQEIQEKEEETPVEEKPEVAEEKEEFENEKAEEKEPTSNDFDILERLNDIKFDSEFYDEYSEYTDESEDKETFEQVVQYDVPEIEPLKQSDELPGEEYELEEVKLDAEDVADFSVAEVEEKPEEEKSQKKKRFFRR